MTRDPPSPRPVDAPREDPGHTVHPAATPADPQRLVFLRAVIWGLIGLIYAPLFLSLSALLGYWGAGPWTYVAAAALAGGAGVLLYSGREGALLGAGVGLAVGVLSLVATTQLLGVQHAVLVAGVIAALIGLHPAFPARCDLQVPTRVVAGVASGALCGTVLAIAEPLHSEPFSAFTLLVFLVSVNGVLYVASLGPLLVITRRVCPIQFPCRWAGALVAGPLAALAAGSIWLMAGPFLGDQGALGQATTEVVYRQLPVALLGGIFGGVLGGALLALFRFPWVYDS